MTETMAYRTRAVSGLILRACPVCREVFSGHSEEEVAAGRMVRVERDGKRLYCDVAADPTEEK